MDEGPPTTTRIRRIGAWAGLVVLLIPTLLAAQERDADTLPGVPLPAELQRVLTDYETAWAERDAAGLAALFTPDGFVLSPGWPPVRGREAIEARYSGRGGPLALRALAYAAEGSVGYIIGAYGPSPGSPASGKFTLTLRRDDTGRWLIASDMDNGNR